MAMYCSNCGAKLEEGQRFCEVCGKKVDTPIPPATDAPDADNPAAEVEPPVNQLDPEQTETHGTPDTGQRARKSKKKVIAIVSCVAAVAIVALICLLVLPLGNTWEKHYELGEKYLSEENYEEAIIEFTAAIELDGSKPEAFEQRANVYILLAEMDKDERAEFTEMSKSELEQSAEADLLQAVELGTETVETYTWLGVYYQEQDDPDKRLEILETGYDRTQSETIKELLDEVQEQKEIRETLQNSKIGDTVKFGSYDGKEIEWIVLEADDNERLLFEKSYLFKRAYCTDEEFKAAQEENELNLVTWKDCELRRWLNSEFYNDAFDSVEKSFILKSEVNNHESPYYQEDTKDCVYILSGNEYYRYFDLFCSLYGPISLLDEGSGNTLDSILDGEGDIKLRLDYSDFQPWVSFVNHYGESDSRAVAQNQELQIRPVVRVEF